MLVSTKGRYALRMMTQLAELDGRTLRMREIGDKQDLSVKYLEQIMIVLKAHGFVESERGPRGGYRLSKPPSEYTVGSIIRAVEGSFSMQCVENPSSCERVEICPSYKLWSMVDEAVSNVIDNVRLSDLISWGNDSKCGIPVCITEK